MLLFSLAQCRISGSISVVSNHARIQCTLEQYQMSVCFHSRSPLLSRRNFNCNVWKGSRVPCKDANRSLGPDTWNLCGLPQGREKEPWLGRLFWNPNQLNSYVLNLWTECISANSTGVTREWILWTGTGLTIWESATRPSATVDTVGADSIKETVHCYACFKWACLLCAWFAAWVSFFSNDVGHDCADVLGTVALRYMTRS